MRGQEHLNLEAWSLPNAVRFYEEERTAAADLYPSEAAMLLPVIGRVSSVLDVGCAVGNARSMLNTLNPAASYVGVDVAEGMVQEAQRRHPGGTFQVIDGRTLPFEDNAFDLVFCAGVLNHTPHYLDLTAEIFRVARRFAVVDLPRLVTQPYAFELRHSSMELKRRFETDSQGLSAQATLVPYILGNVEDVFRGLHERLGGRLAGLGCHGYYGKPHPSVTIPVESVIFTVVLLVKGRPPLRYCLTLPEDARPSAEAALRSRGVVKVASVETLLAMTSPQGFMKKGGA